MYDMLNGLYTIQYLKELEIVNNINFNCKKSHKVLYECIKTIDNVLRDFYKNGLPIKEFKKFKNNCDLIITLNLACLGRNILTIQAISARPAIRTIAGIPPATAISGKIPTKIPDKNTAKLR